MTTNTDAAEQMLSDLTEVVKHIGVASPSSTGVHSALAAMVFSDNHIASARASGHDAGQTVAALQRQVGDVIESLKNFARSMPEGDANVASISDLIARLA